jgi:hypothetical protein
MARGVPLASDGTFSMAFFTDFTPRGYVGLLDWYTVSVENGTSAISRDEVILYASWVWKTSRRR